MQALIFDTHSETQARVAAVLMDKGFHVICVDSAGAARAFLASGMVDLLVAGDTGQGFTEAVMAMVGHGQADSLNVIVMTDRHSGDFDQLGHRLPGYYGAMGRAIAPQLVGKLALSAVADVDEGQGRARRKAFIDAQSAKIARGVPQVPAEFRNTALTHAAYRQPLSPAPVEKPKDPAPAQAVDLLPAYEPAQLERRLHLA